MELFQNLFRISPPPPIPTELPSVPYSKAAHIALSSEPGPAAIKLLTPQQTPSQYLAALQERQMGDEMVKFMAHGLPDKQGVLWAVRSAEMVADKVSVEDAQAMQAAKSWVENPNAKSQAAAASAAARTNLQGPGAWAAQAATWAQLATPGALPASGGAFPRLTPHAVSAAVLLASAIAAGPKPAASKRTEPAPSPPDLPVQPVAGRPAAPLPVIPPKVQTQMFKAQQPFIALGLDLASGKVAPA